jgi:hypothetical protein
LPSDPASRHGEALADADRPGTLSQRHVAQQPAQAERAEHDDGSGEEDWVERSRNGRHVEAVDRGRQIVDDGGACTGRHVHAARGTLGELVTKPIGEYRAEDGDADRA